VPQYLQELKERFSAASSGQIQCWIGCAEFVGALVLGNLLADGIAAELGGLVAFVRNLLAVTGILGVPLVRYFWIQWRNSKISDHNQHRQARAQQLASADAALEQNCLCSSVCGRNGHRSRGFHTTETDLLEQEAERSAQIDAEWQRRLSFLRRSP